MPVNDDSLSSGALTNSSRFSTQRTGRSEAAQSFADAVEAGLSEPPRSLPCRFLYDHVGSELFEAICGLREYYPTRTERSILEAHAADIAAAAPQARSLVELGSGSAIKTRLLIEAMLERHGEIEFVPIDISESALAQSAEQLLRDYADLRVHAIEGEYEGGLAWLAEQREAGPRLVIWLGSSIGNLDRQEACHFLKEVRSCLGRDDRLLLGIDLRKDGSTLEAAYDDAEGVTARFNLNLLARINRELGGHFELADFAHRARYLADEGRVELTLESLAAQRVRIDALEREFEFAAGEAIHTENAFKYSPDEIDALARSSGFAKRKRWFDKDRLFSLTLLAPQ